MLLTSCALNDWQKTMNKRPVTKYWKLAIFWATIGFSANFSVSAPKCRCDDKHQNTCLKP